MLFGGLSRAPKQQVLGVSAMRNCKIARYFIIVLCISCPAYAADTRYNFLQQLQKVSPGMTRQETEVIMSSYPKGTNWPYSPAPSMKVIGSERVDYELDPEKKEQLTLKGCDVYRHSDEGQYDSDWGIVCYDKDKVVWTDFAPD